MAFRLSLATLAVACLPLGLAQAEDFKIGVIQPLTGPGAEIGRRNAEGVKGAIELANERGGIGGMHVSEVVCDTQSVEQQAVLCTRRLVTEEKVNLLAAAGTTPQTLAIVPTVEAAKVPLFSIAGGTILFKPLRTWVFKALAGNDDQIPAAVDFLKAKGVQRLAIIRDNGPFGTDVAENLKPYAAKLGIEIVAEEIYSPTDTDMTAQVTRLRAAKPDAIFDMSSNPPPGAIIAKKIAQLGMTVPIVVGSNLQTSDFAKLSGDAADQLLFIGQKASMNQIAPDDPLAANIAGFRAAFAKANPGSELVALSTSAADLVLIAQVAAKPLGAKALDGETLRQALEGVKALPVIQGIWTFSPTSHDSALKDGIALLNYRSGNWVAAQ